MNEFQYFPSAGFGIDADSTFSVSWYLECINDKNQLFQLRTARTVFSILIIVRLYPVMPEVCRWVTNEKQRKTDIRLTDQ